MKRLIILVAALAVAAAACGGAAGDQGAGGLGTPSPVEESRTPRPTPEPESTGGSTPTPSPDGTVTYEVWFTMGDRLFMTKRTQAATEAVGRASIEALLAGPSPEEREAGVGTQVPVGTEQLGIAIADGLATVDLTGDFEAGGGSASVIMRIAQVVYTVTQFPSVETVQFRIDGKDVPVITDHGILNEPAGRADYADQLPAIVVESPLIGEQVSNPVSIAGTAIVFEATVSMRVVDADGNEVGLDFTTATCGSGCRGTYQHDLAYAVDREQEGIVEVFESSAEDGRPINVISIPVVLTP